MKTPPGNYLGSQLRWGRLRAESRLSGGASSGPGRSLVTRQEELVQRADSYLSSLQKRASELPASNSVLVLQEQLGRAKKNVDELVVHNKLVAERLSRM